MDMLSKADTYLRSSFGGVSLFPRVPWWKSDHLKCFSRISVPASWHWLVNWERTSWKLFSWWPNNGSALGHICESIKEKDCQTCALQQNAECLCCHLPEEPSISQQTWVVGPTLVYCWPTVYDAGQTVNQRWVNVSCLLGWYTIIKWINFCHIWPNV